MARHTAYSYIRFSTPEQAMGDSLRRQLEKTESYVAKHGLVLDSTLDLLDAGVSGFRGKNAREGALGRFLAMVDSGEIASGSYLLIEAFDRFSRDEMWRALLQLLSLIDKGVRVVTLDDDEEFSADSLQGGFEGMFRLLYSIMKMEEAHNHSQQKSERLRKARESTRKKIRDGEKVLLTSICPAWMQASEDPETGGKCFELIPERVEIIREIFQMSADGLGSEKIASVIAADHEPWGHQGRKAARWERTYVNKIINNDAVIGVLRPHTKDEDGKRVPAGPPIADYYPRAIPIELWEASNEAKKDRVTGDDDEENGASGKKPGSRAAGRIGENVTNLFTGIAQCGYTGFPYVHHNHGDGCVQLKSRRPGPDGKALSWAYDDLEYQILRIVENADLARVLGKPAETESKEIASRVSELRHEVELSGEKMTSYRALIDEGGAPVSEVGKWIAEEAEKRAKVESALQEAEARLMSAKKMAAKAKHAHKSLAELIARRKEPQVRLRLRGELRRIIDTIVVWPRLAGPRSAVAIGSKAQLEQIKNRHSRQGTPLTPAYRTIIIEFKGGEKKTTELRYAKKGRVWVCEKVLTSASGRSLPESAGILTTRPVRVVMVSMNNDPNRLADGMLPAERHLSKKYQATSRRKTSKGGTARRKRS